MARAKGPLGNAPRDVQDDFVGAAAEHAPGGPPLRWPPNPKRMVRPKDTFHAKVVGDTTMPRADRAPHFRKGGWVSGFKRDGRAEGGSAAAQEAREAAAKTMRSRRDTPDAFPTGGMGSIDNSQKPLKERQPELYGRGLKRGGALSRVASKIHKGGLHESLGIPQGEKIPPARIEAATHSDKPKVKKQAILAQTFAKHRPK